MTPMEQLRVDNVHVESVTPLVPPATIKQELPITPEAAETVMRGRERIKAILSGNDPRLLVIVGPCSIHDTDAALEYAHRLHALAKKVDDRIVLVMRTYFEKPRTTVGWKGLINDPHLNGTYDVETGLRRARQVLLDINALGVPTASELLDPIVPQFVSDLISWASIGARTTESQTHREMASGLSMPVGYKNSTDGNLQVAINAMLSARRPHHFLGINQEGITCVVATTGNAYGHLILRGGTNGPNYDSVHVSEAEQQLEQAGLDARIVVDCSHANCNKQYELQESVLRDVVSQRLEDTPSLVGVMLESNLEPGRQDLPDTPEGLLHGISVTDPCLGWAATANAIMHAHERLGAALVG